MSKSWQYGMFAMDNLPPAMNEAIGEIELKRINNDVDWFIDKFNSLSDGAQRCWQGFTRNADDWRELFNCFGVYSSAINKEMYGADQTKNEIEELIKKLEL